ncbi:MAG: response regulator, partial [Burkholderiaceae bacterium]
DLLHTPPLTKLLRELSGIAGHAVKAKDQERMGLELATCLLFIENSLDQITNLPANFSARADEISARLLSVVGGEVPETQASWIGEISREAQQRQTMAALVGEMQLSLKQAEKALDEHFRDPSNTTILGPVDGVLGQIGGALAILDQDVALEAVNYTRGLVKEFSEGSEDKDPASLSASFNKVAQNVGALSFFIETLQSQPELAKKRFSFDAATGIFETKLLEKAPEKELLPSVELERSAAVVTTAEQDLIEQQKESERLLASLAEAPQNSQLQAQLKDSLDSERSFAALLDDTEASARAKSAIELLNTTDISQAADALGEIVTASSHVEQVVEIEAPKEIPESEAEIDAELLEIFLMEADEVLGAVRENIPLSRAEASNQEYLIRLRRSFHTLKGSGRMVGLNVFGEGAWNIEQVMNLWLAESRSGTEALYQLLEYAAQEMYDWVEELKTRGSSSRNSDLIIAAAIRVKEGGAFSLDAAEPTPLVADVAVEPAPVAAPVGQTQALESLEEAPTNEELPVAALESEPAASSIEPMLDPMELRLDDAAIEAGVAVVAVEESAPVLEMAETIDFAMPDEAMKVEEPLTLVSDELAPDVAPEEEIVALALPDDDAELPMLAEVIGEIAGSVEPEETAVHVLEPVSESVEELAASLEQFVADDASEVPTDVPVVDVHDSHVVELVIDSEADSEVDSAVAPLVAEALDDSHMPSPEESVEETIEIAALVEDSVDEPVIALEAEETTATAPEAPTSEPDPAPVKTAQIIEFPDFSMPVAPEADNTKRIGDIEISLPLHTIYMAETDEIVRFLAQDFAEWRHEASRPVSRHAVHASHSLAGSSATVGLYAAQELAHNLENVLQRLERHPVELEPSEFDLLDHVVECVKAMLQKFALSEMAERVPHENQRLIHLLEAVSARSDAGDDEEFITSTNERIDDFLEAEEQVEASTVSTTDAAPDQESLLAPELDLAVAEILAVANVAEEVTPEPLLEPEAFAAIEMPANAVPVDTVVTSTPTPSVVVPDAVDRVTTGMELKVSDEIDHDLLPVFLEEGNDLLPMVGQLLRSWQASPEDDAIPQSILRLMHTVKGSARMAGAMQLGQHTHDMETRIENLMHTGSAIRQPLLEDLVARHDYSMYLFERLQNPDLQQQAAPMPSAEVSIEEEINQFQEEAHAAAMAEAEAKLKAAEAELAKLASSESVSDVVPTAPTIAEVPTSESNKLVEVKTEVKSAPTPSFVPSTAARQVAPQVASANPASVPLVRVRADILDRLVNQAGEVSISRSKLENEVDTLKLSLSELTENVSRLRDQLREVEIQAETQISSRMAFSGDREFDPLEFDRFTRLQELTRMMAESVNDVASVQSSLNRTIEGATTDLNAQARLTRELQQDLMRVRMVQFSSVSERLYRIARQTAKEMDKRVNLDIRGTSVEIDRSVLEKMVGPFEHMLRNPIVHGIESRQHRVNRGKSEVGELLIEIRQEGNEVVIHFTDDGQGLNINRIREKAKTVGLLTDETQVSEAEVVNMIFEPGFSTASEVTELAGRGVGMDVVRSEAASLGGRVAVSSVEGKGAHFTIHLPLTLAVTQVVILNAGGKTFAVPSVLVEQVQQLKSAALATAYNDGAIMWQGARVPLHYLPSMLGERDATPDTQQYTPILIMKSDQERVAIHVDQIIGNREVVVKNVGPQLARMIGIAGATVLGSGDIVLILNPVPLAQKLEQERAKLPEVSVDANAGEMGAVAELVPSAATPTSVEPVQGLRTHHIVMVVDDSLTVRRVTQRLLVREGYQVVLAKDGIDALEQLQSITPDVMLVDIEMPRMDGFDLTRNVRSDSRTTHIPIIMITSRTADKHRNYAMELGVNEYFGKPYREDDLLAAISGFVNKEATVDN